MRSRTDRPRQLASALDSKRLSRRRLLETASVGAGALALGGLTGPQRTRAQDSQSNEVTGDFNWKRDDGVTIKALLNEHPYQQALIDNLEAFSTLTGITVEYDIFPENNYFDKLTVDLTSGQPTYDVFMLGAYMVWQYGPPGYLEDMMPWITNASATNPEYDWEDIYPNLRAADQWSLVTGDPLGTGGQYALPWGFETNTIMYNKEVFEKLGMKPAETFDDLIQLAADLTAAAPGAGYDGMYGIGARGSRQWATIHPGYMTMYSRLGGKDFDLVDGTLTPVMNSDISVDFSSKWATMLKESGPANWTNYFWYDVGNDFGAQKSAMIFDADILGFFQNQPGAGAVSGKVAWHPGPTGPDGSLATNQWIWSLGMSAESEKKSAAWTFLQWATGKEHLLLAATTGGNMVDPVRKSVVDNADFQTKMGANVDYLNTFGAIIDQTKILFTPQPSFFEATTLWAGALQEIYGGADAKETLDDLIEEIQSQAE